MEEKTIIYLHFHKFFGVFLCDMYPKNDSYDCGRKLPAPVLLSLLCLNSQSGLGRLAHQPDFGNGKNKPLQR